MTDIANIGAIRGESGRPAPLVEPISDLTSEQVERASRQLILPGFGMLAQRRLAAARVLVIGAGGLGSSSVPYLAGSGIGTIGIIDDDEVEISNLHRQVAHRTADIGRRKVTSLADVVRALDPGVRVVEHDLRLTSGNALDIFREYDLVIDGSDNFPTRYLANDAAQLTGIPLVWGAILAHHGQVGVAWHAYGPGYRDLFPAPPAPEDAISCEVGGVLPGLCGTVGSLLATEALKLITGLGDPLIGRVLVYDALTARTREIAYERDLATSPPSGLIDYELFCAGEGGPRAISASELVQRIQSRDGMRLIDVRRPIERELLRVDDAEVVSLLLLEIGGSALDELQLSPGPVTVFCATEPRSIRAARVLRERGVDARYLSGGIDALARVAPALVTRYSTADPAGAR